MDLLESHNPYSDWISLELVPVAIAPARWELQVNLDFQENWQPLLKGKIKWGLKGGQLKIKLTQCHLTQDCLWETTETDTFTWILAPETNQAVHQRPFSLSLGTLTPTAEAFNVTVSFIPSLADFSITDAEGLWKYDISPNKHGILERAIARYLQNNCCHPHISYLQMGTGKIAIAQPTTSVNPEQLETLIEKIYQASTDHFIQLAELAHLNPLEDFAGGNLLAAELSGLSLGGANLHHINLRGANLTDIDLSEANLRGAKLSGADLSGAYLGNSDLSYADLHRASLALSNLIGANLQGANLEEANLSNANLSSANLAGAVFGNNPGLSEELEAMILSQKMLS